MVSPPPSLSLPDLLADYSIVSSSQEFGLIRSYEKVPTRQHLNTINARSEKIIAGGGMWGGLRDQRRCVVCCSGFYEWLSKGKEKLPYFTKLQAGGIMMIAGLWDEVDYMKSEPSKKTFAIITTDTNKQLAFVRSILSLSRCSRMLIHVLKN